jgi:hypothetical protein
MTTTEEILAALAAFEAEVRSDRVVLDELKDACEGLGPRAVLSIPDDGLLEAVTSPLPSPRSTSPLPPIPWLGLRG